MKTLYVINDLHLSAVRSGGTTLASALAVRESLQAGFKHILSMCDSDVLINGDFADSYRMITADILEAHRTITAWLERGHTLYALPGNHCLSRTSTDISSFELLFQLLQQENPEQVKLMMHAGPVRDGMYAVPHVHNNEALTLELESVPPCRYLFLHANYNNFFTVQSDMSLNISEERASSLPVEHIIFGHEHKARTALDGKVVVVGNQLPSSVADCLGVTAKYMLKISDSGMEHIQTWQAEGEFVELDWQALTITDHKFIRVTGTATADQAGAVVTAISRYRQISPAFVITNGVKIASSGDSEVFEQALDGVQAFSIMSALREFLTPEEITKIEGLANA